MKKIKKYKDNCGICGDENMYVYWEEEGDSTPYENSFFLCHKCGFFARQYGGKNKDFVFGVTFDPKKIPLKGQLNVIRKKRDHFEGLVITDHFNHRFNSKQVSEESKNTMDED